MNPEPTQERTFLGMVEVDSGTLILGDPMYCLPDAERGKPGIDYDAVMKAPAAPRVYLDGRPVMLLSQFGGDGTYPVYAEKAEDGEIERITIEFVGPDDDEDDT